MNISLTKFCKDHELPKSSVYRRCQELNFDTSDGLTPEQCDRLLLEFDVAPVVPALPPAPEQSVQVEVGNHSIVLAPPSMPERYTLEGLRDVDFVSFDDPLAIAQQFIQTADRLTEEMQRDIRLREQKLQQTQQAKDQIAQKANEFKLEARLYKERTSMLATAQTAETTSLQDALKTLQSLGKPGSTDA